MINSGVPNNYPLVSRERASILGHQSPTRLPTCLHLWIMSTDISLLALEGLPTQVAARWNPTLNSNNCKYMRKIGGTGKYEYTDAEIVYTAL